MSKSDADRLTDEILAAIDQVGGIEAWVDTKLDGSVDSNFLDEACGPITVRLLGAEPPDTGRWERFLVTLAAHSRESRENLGLEQCRAIIGSLVEMLDKDRFAHADPARLVTIASALTVALAAQKSLRQPIETAIKVLCEKFDSLAPEIAERCQDIWKRRGQMSGESTLFVWDTRNDEWRLAQDFKSYRPAE